MWMCMSLCTCSNLVPNAISIPTSCPEMSSLVTKFGANVDSLRSEVHSNHHVVTTILSWYSYVIQA